jgi:hypothetical protein
MYQTLERNLQLGTCKNFINEHKAKKTCSQKIARLTLFLMRKFDIKKQFVICELFVIVCGTVFVFILELSSVCTGAREYFQENIVAGNGKISLYDVTWGNP